MGFVLVALLCLLGTFIIDHKGDQYYEEFEAEDRICLEEFHNNVINDLGYQPEWLAESMRKLNERR